MCSLKRKLFSLLLVFCFLETPTLGGKKEWEAASEGKSSFVDLLPPEAYEITPVRKVEGARLVLLNQELAELLGLTGSTPEETEKLFIDHFAVTTQNAENSSRKMFATYYREGTDQTFVKLGKPLGDGRVVWSGEHQIRLKTGETLYLDFSLKGVGRTKQARKQITDQLVDENFEYFTHSDGLQSMREAVRSFVTSNSISRNGQDVVQDLAVIEIPFEKIKNASGEKAKAAVTVRVGRQTRPAHLWYHTNSPKNFKRVFEYVVNRDLGKSLDHIPTNKDILQHFEKLADQLSTQAAFYSDMNFLHGSFTLGNQTTSGTPIDFGTFEVLDANHSNYRFFYEELTLSEQPTLLQHYFNDHAKIIIKGKYRVSGSDSEVIMPASIVPFHKNYRDKLAIFYLKRLGLTEKQISDLSSETLAAFSEMMVKISKSGGKKKVKLFSQKIIPAAFDVRLILANSMKLIHEAKEGGLSQEASREKWVKLFVTKRDWGTLRSSDFRKASRFFSEGTYAKALDQYVNIIEEIYTQLERKSDDIEAVVLRAQRIGRNVRLESNFPKINALISSVSDPTRSFTENSAQAEKIIESLVDYPGENEITRGYRSAFPTRATCETSFGKLAK